jgi:mannose/fructose-specific phosphotransferase system component IIA
MIPNDPVAPAPLRPAGLLVTHASLGQELLRTVEAILGAQTDVHVLSNDGYSGEALSRAIEERVREVPGERPVVIFTDLAAGSCGIASRRADHGARAVRKVTGVNLPMLLEFFHYRDTLPLDELLPRLEAKGKAGITVT